MSSIQSTHEIPEPPPTPLPGPGEVMSAALVLLLAVATGLSVACLYYCQPMLALLGQDLGVSERVAGLIPTLTQAGYALGIFFLVPLGDRHDRRSIMLIKIAALTAALLLAGLSRSIHGMLLASLAIGLSATLAQDIVPTAATLAPPARRGKVVGTVMTGLLLGILLSRVVSGLVAEHLSWRAMFIAAAASILLTTPVIWRYVPHIPPSTHMSYRALLGSLLKLWQDHRDLRKATLAQGLLSISFSAFWSTLAIMLHGEPFHMGSTVAGAFGLAGAAGALAAPIAGHLADRRGPERVTQAGTGLSTAAFAALAAATLLPASQQIWVLAVGTVVFDLGVQASLIAHQSVIYRIDPAARSRLNAILIAGMFICMALGSALGNLLLVQWGWLAVMGLATASAGAAFVVRLRPH